jgi:hypothetical protein
MLPDSVERNLNFPQFGMGLPFSCSLVLGNPDLDGGGEETKKGIRGDMLLEVHGYGGRSRPHCRCWVVVMSKEQRKRLNVFCREIKVNILL